MTTLKGESKRTLLGEGRVIWLHEWVNAQLQEYARYPLEIEYRWELSRDYGNSVAGEWCNDFEWHLDEFAWILLALKRLSPNNAIKGTKCIATEKSLFSPIWERDTGFTMGCSEITRSDGENWREINSRLRSIYNKSVVNESDFPIQYRKMGNHTCHIVSLNCHNPRFTRYQTIIQVNIAFDHTWVIDLFYRLSKLVKATQIRN